MKKTVDETEEGGEDEEWMDVEDDDLEIGWNCLYLISFY
jgi:hypothetical protein